MSDAESIRDLMHCQGAASVAIDRLRQELPWHPLVRQYAAADDSRKREIMATVHELLEGAALAWDAEPFQHLLGFLEAAEIGEAADWLRALAGRLARKQKAVETTARALEACATAPAPPPQTTG